MSYELNILIITPHLHDDDFQEQTISWKTLSREGVHSVVQYATLLNN